MNPAPPQLKPPGSLKNTGEPLSQTQSKRNVIILLAVLLPILALGVLFVLPTSLEQSDPSQSAPASPQATSQTPATNRAPTPAIAGVTQHDAGLALQAFLRLRAQPELSNAEIWAPQRLAEAMDSAQLGDDHYGHRRFKQALSAYEIASQQLESVRADRPKILAETLASAKALLLENEVDPAISAFERVLAMQENHADAQAGLEKARVREQVLDLMKDGQEAEAASNPGLAAEAYSATLALDANHQPARSALQAVNKLLAQQAYQAAMSAALAHIDAGNLQAADNALNMAETVHADTPELQDARRRLQSARQQAKLRGLRKQAQAQAEQENWSDAISSYKKALTIEAQATFASTGLQHAKARLKLNTQLDHYLTAPERLASEAPLENANTLLQANPGVAANEPLLAAKLLALREAVALATTPVTLLIESDNQTQVTIYHVGRLGSFDQKQISLRPGRYTITGSRAGYRDVRKVVALGGASPASVIIRCEERI